jgi:hypothetical protein
MSEYKHGDDDDDHGKDGEKLSTPKETLPVEGTSSIEPDKVIVMAKLKKEDTDWVGENLKE